MTRRRVKPALELISAIGSKAHDLQGYGPVEIAKAMAFMRDCGNGPMFDWLVAALAGPTRDVASSCAHCASLEQQVADMTRQRDELSQQLTENADVGSRAIAGNRALIAAALAAAQLATAYRERAEAAESQLAEMAKERDAANQRYDLIERDLCSYIDAARAADAALVTMREQADVWRSRAHQLRTTTPVSAFDEQQADAYEVCGDDLSALLDPQDQP